MLRIRELTLAGFGVYERPTRFLLPDGPAVFWGANETGKSTFLWGVASVWFGLPQNSDPSKVGTSRFRSFSRPEEFWGELVWERDGRTYRLRRDFDRHKVCLTEESGGGVTEIFHGEHNPSGRSSAGSAFPPELRKAIGIGSMDMFLETFCLTQPFVGDAEIESELQHLISGSRSVKVDDVLAHIFGEIKTLTKNTGELGLVRPGTSRPTNQREDGRVEQLQSELARARLALELGRRQLEQIHSEGIDVREIEGEARELRARIEERERRLQALARWTELQDERGKRAETVSRLEGSLRELDSLARDRERIENASGEHNPIYDSAPEDAADRLEALERVEREREAAEGRESEHRAGRAKLEAKIAEIEAKLSGDHADVRGRRDWVDVRNRLREAAARVEQVEVEIRRLQEEATKRTRDLEATASLDGTVVAAARTQATVILDAHDRVTRLETKLAVLRKQTEERSALEDQGRISLLRESMELEIERKEREAEVRSKRVAVVLAKDLLEQAEHAKPAEGQAADLSQGGSPRLDGKESTAAGAGGDGDGRPGAEDAPAMATWSSRSPEKSGPPPAAITILSLLLGAAVTLVTSSGLSWSLPSAIGLGLGVTAIVFLLLARVGTGSQSARNRMRESDAPPGQRLRRHLEETRDEFGAVVNEPETAHARQEMRAALEEAETQLALALAHEGEVEKRLTEIREELGEIAKTTGTELARMEERWKLLDEQIVALEQERAELLEERFGASDDPHWPSTPVAETTEALESLLLLPGGPSPEDNPSLDDLLGWLARLDDADWSAFQDAETARADAVRELGDVRRRLRQAEERRADRKEIEELEARFHPFTLETDPRWLLDHQEECEELERLLARAQSQLEAMGPAERPIGEAGLATELWTALAQDWPALVEPDMDRKADEPLHEWAARARKELSAARNRSLRTSSLDEASPRVLRSAGVKSRNELESLLAAERAALGLAVRDLETLERTEIALADASATDAADRADKLGQRRAVEIAAQEEDRGAHDRIEAALREKMREQATLEGKELPNLAALELRIGSLEIVLEETQLRCDALVQAFRWAEEATETFRATYRESLAERIDLHFSHLTGVAGRRVELGDNFALRVRDPRGRLLESEQLSQGARDQLLLAMRLGVADLLAEAVPLPFLFDDPFVHFDETRLEQLKSGLDLLGEERQWILLTHRNEMSRWADPVFTAPHSEDAASVHLAGETPARTGERTMPGVSATIRLIEAETPEAAESGAGTLAQAERRRQSQVKSPKKDGEPPTKPAGGRQGKLFDLWGRS